MSNLDTIHQMYGAYARGDIDTILGYLADTVEWEYGSESTDVPWLEPRQGRAAARGFFTELAGMEFQRFTPTTFLENGNVVVVILDAEFTVKATGCHVTEVDEIHIWHFNDAGKVARFRHRADTHQHWLAFKGTALRKAG